MIWFTSDTHYGHDNIIRLCKRPFSNVDEMNDVLIKNLNHHVRPSDTLYHLGDFCWGSNLEKYRSRINCNNIILITGNHDGHIEDNKHLFSEVCSELTFKFAKKYIHLHHYPLREWPYFWRNSYHLYGHCHGNQPNYHLSFDVGVDPMKYNPISIDEVFIKMKGLKNNAS